MILFEFENFLFNIIFSYDLSYLLFFIIEIFLYFLYFLTHIKRGNYWSTKDGINNNAHIMQI